jgi:hypothetical protein
VRCARVGLLVAGCLGLSSCLGPPLVILPATLPNAVQGGRYAENLNTSDNKGAPFWQISAGALPPGLSIDGQTGVLAGHPTMAGSFDFTVSVSESLPRREGSQEYALTVLPQLLVQFAPTPARVAIAYEYMPLIEGGVPPYTATVTGLPAGLDFDPTTGTISGTPLNDNSGLHLDLSVSDQGAPQQVTSDHATLVVHPLGVAITTTALPNAAVSVAYGATFDATQGLPPYAWRITAGVLPSGLRVNQFSGELSGTPTVHSRTETFTVTVTDSDTPSSSDSRALKLVVPVIITTDTLPPATKLVAYNNSVAAAAGLPPYTWEVSVGTLPDGLALDPATGAISGTPAALATNQTFTVRATDSDAPATSAEQELTIQVP